jgi:hypothetical protein
LLLALLLLCRWSVAHQSTASGISAVGHPHAARREKTLVVLFLDAVKAEPSCCMVDMLLEMEFCRPHRHRLLLANPAVSRQSRDSAAE